MIKMNIIGYPIFYQSDNTYQLPHYSGAVQWNGNTKKFEVSTGTGWQSIDHNITINTDNNLMQCIKWITKKMAEEQELEKKAKNNPALADLLSQRKKIEEQINTIEILTN